MFFIKSCTQIFKTRILQIILITDNTNTEYLTPTQCTAGKVSKYEVFSDLYSPTFGLNTGKYGPEKTRYLDTFHAVIITRML